MQGAVCCQHRMLRCGHLRSIAVLHRPGAGQSADSGFGKVRAGHDVQNAWAGFGGLAANGNDIGAGMRRTNHEQVGDTGHFCRDIVDIIAGAGNETCVFLAPKRSADPVHVLVLPPGR